MHHRKHFFFVKRHFKIVQETSILLICFLLTLFGNVNAIADNMQPLSNVKQLCIVDAGTGFNWLDSRWNLTNFIEPKYIVSKVDIPKHIKDVREVRAFLKERGVINTDCGNDYLKFISDPNQWGNSVLDDFKIYPACLRIQRVDGGEQNDIACKEFHSRYERSVSWNVTFDCAENFSTKTNFIMRMNGNFHYSSVHGNVESAPKNDYKGSLLIFVGKCTDMAN